MAGKKGSITGSFIPLVLIAFALAASEDRARYDHYRLYRVQLVSDEQVRIFQDLEATSDSCTFYGHARQPGQELTIMVSASKVADFEDLLDRFLVSGRVLVRCLYFGFLMILVLTTSTL